MLRWMVSTLVLWLLKKRGYQVEGLFMKNWEEDDNEYYCHAAKDLADAQSVCDHLKIFLHKVNFSAEYWDNVFDKCLKYLKKGYTPNPDILCNKEIKFKTFFSFATNNLKADFIATGHYVRKKSINGIYYLSKAIDTNKDQSYFLYTLNSNIISKSLFPIGDFTKKHIRQIANNLNLITANKKDSTGICFIGKKNFNNFLSKYLSKIPGNIINIKNNEVLGQHIGFMYYTIGQRKGLGIGGIKKYNSKKAWYVVDKNIIFNEIIVSQGKNNKYLLSFGCYASHLHIVNIKTIKNPLKCFIKTRYRQQEVACTVWFEKNYEFANIYFDKLIKAITPGQSVVFYIKNKICLGGGIIKYRFPII